MVMRDAATANGATALDRGDVRRDLRVAADVRGPRRFLVVTRLLVRLTLLP